MGLLKGVGSLVAFLLFTISSFSVSADSAPQPYDVKFWVEASPGAELEAMVVEVHPEWAPKGAARFRELVDANYYDDCKFFRSIKNFVAQFGLAADPQVTNEWTRNRIKDDPVEHSNLAGTLTFATSGADSRTTQLFFNFVDNTRLDKMGFSPFAVVKASSIPILKKINTDYGEKPNQGKITKEGNAYLEREFPKLSAIKYIEVVSGGNLRKTQPPWTPKLGSNHQENKHAGLVIREQMYERGAHLSPDDDDHPFTGRFCAGPHCGLWVVGVVVVLLLYLKNRNGYHIVRQHVS